LAAAALRAASARSCFNSACSALIWDSMAASCSALCARAGCGAVSSAVESAVAEASRTLLREIRDIPVS